MFANNLNNIALSTAYETDEKLEAYYSSKNISYNCPKYFIRGKDVLAISPIVSSMRSDDVSNEESLKLRAEIESYEQEIRELELSRKMKLVKV